ncbi:MAG: hypothetical protein JWM85_1654 [Acidimicrobiaceae bacterium]|nr:hypothetical protein [Acidimicrobiaceae bacterium]
MAHLREERTSRGWDQAHVAELMSELGFGWSRVTVSDAETARRRIGIDELLGLVAIFHVPLLQLIWPRIDEHLAITPMFVLEGGELHELVMQGHIPSAAEERELLERIANLEAEVMMRSEALRRAEITATAEMSRLFELERAQEALKGQLRIPRSNQARKDNDDGRS